MLSPKTILQRALPLTLLALALCAHAATYETTSTGIPLHWFDQDTSTPATLDIFYDFRDYNGYANVVTPAEQTVFVQALTDWSTITGNKIVFTQSTTLPDSAILNLGVSDLAAVGGTSGGSTLGICQPFFYSDGSIPQAIVRLDSTRTWDLTIGNGNPAQSATQTSDFYSVALHEIGHALGLNHTENPVNNIMAAALAGEKLGPSVDDINGIDNNYSVNPAPFYNSISRTLASFIVGSPFNGTANKYYNYFSGNPSVFAFYTDSGTTNITGNLTVQDGSAFHMSGGVWSCNALNLDVSGTGTFDLSGGTFTTQSIGGIAGSVINLSGGILSVKSISLKGAFNWIGGTLSITGGGGLYFGVPTTVPTTGLLKTTGALNQSALTINGGVQFLRNGTAQSTSKITTFTLAGGTNAWTGKLDLTDNFLIIEPAVAAKAATLSTLANQILSGFHNGDWLGSGITSATVAADPAHLGLGLFDNAVLGKTSFGTGTNDVTSNSILITQSLLGDANFDNTVNATDLNLIANNWHTTEYDWAHGDLNLDGFVDSLDVNIVLAHWNPANPFAPQINYTSGFSYALIPVPEPATLPFLFGALFLLKRRPHKAHFIRRAEPPRRYSGMQSNNATPVHNTLAGVRGS